MKNQPQKNVSSGRVALPSGGGRGGSDFSDQKERKRLRIFIVASNSLETMTNRTCSVYVNTELESRF
jgi:hypothetical protein